MASSAFKSTTKRTPIGASGDDSASTNRSSIHRRSRSLSRFSHRMPSSPEDKAFDETSAPRGRFVNTRRGSGFPEISLDDLAVEFFGSADRDRSASRNSVPRATDVDAASSHRRGRSVSRHGSSKPNANGSDGKGRASYSGGGEKVVPESNSRRRRSVSVVRYQISDSESDLDGSQNSGTRVKEKSFGIGNKQKPISHKTDDSNRRPVLRRSLSQKDFKCHDGYSSQSSVLTDEEGKDIYLSHNGKEKTIRSIYVKKAEQHPIGDVVNNGLYEAMCKELRHAMKEKRGELKQEVVNRKSSVAAITDDLHSNDFGALHHSSLTRNHSTKLEQSERRKDFLPKMVLEEQHGKKLSKTVKIFPSDQKHNIVEDSSRMRKSNDRSRMSKRLSEEAEKYIEDFISNVEDTDISSLDGDRSDTSSSIGGMTKPNFKIPAVSKHVSSGMDGVKFPWLQWETGNDSSPYPYPWRNKMEPPMTPKTIPRDVTQDGSNAQDHSNHSASSQGSWSPGVNVGLSSRLGEDVGSRFRKPINYQNQSNLIGSKESRFDMEEYFKRPSNEDFLLERWKQQQKINSSGHLLCNRIFL